MRKQAFCAFNLDDNLNDNLGGTQKAQKYNLNADLDLNDNLGVTQITRIAQKHWFQVLGRAKRQSRASDFRFQVIVQVNTM